jgi:hypothetical protein
MTDELLPISRDNIPTLLDKRNDGLVIIAFCPLCDQTEQAPDDGQGRDHVAAAAIAKVKRHISKAHPLRPSRVKTAPNTPSKAGARKPVRTFDAF